MLTVIRKVYFWPSMQKNIIEYLTKCLECQQVKVEHQHPARLLQPIPVPEWKWEVISLDSITRLPRSKRHNDSIMVVVEFKIIVYINFMFQQFHCQKIKKNPLYTNLRPNSRNQFYRSFAKK